MRVGDYFYLGTEKEASNRRLLCELGVKNVLNVGYPQTMNFFEEDVCCLLRYGCVELFDNKECNLTSVVLRMAIPFLDGAVERKERTLVHCKTGRSKSPAVMVAWLMMRGRLSLLDAFRCIGGAKVSDVLLGELLLLEQALADRGVEPLPRPVVLPPLSWIACEGHEDVIVASLKEQFVAGRWWKCEDCMEPWSVERVLSLRSYAWDPMVLGRQAAWEAAPALLQGAATVKSLYEVLAGTRVVPEPWCVPVEVSLRAHLLPQKREMARELADLLDLAMRSRAADAREQVTWALKVVKRLRSFVELDLFCGHVHRQAAARLLSQEADHELEVEVAMMLNSSLTSNELGRHLLQMVTDVSKRPAFEDALLSKVTTLTPDCWVTCFDATRDGISPIALPPSMQEAFERAKSSLSPNLALISTRGTVEMSYGEKGTTLVVPTDCACLIWAFNFHEQLSVDHLVAITAIGAARVQVLLKGLVQKGLFVAVNETDYAVNNNFKTKQKRITLLFE